MKYLINVTKSETLLPPFDVDMLDEPPFIPTNSPVVKAAVTQNVTHINMTKVLNGRSVDTALYLAVQEHMAARMTHLQFETLYTLRKMCGESFWKSLGTITKKCDAGRAFAHMVVKGKFPFEFVQYKRSVTIDLANKG